MSLLIGLSAASKAALVLSEEGHEASKLFGLPFWVWQLLNLGLFIALLLYFVARPLGEAFRKRQDEVEQRRLEAEKKRAVVEGLAREIRERTAKIEKEIEEIRRQGIADGEEVRREFAARAEEEVVRIRKESGEEIERRLAAAREELRQAAADLTGTTAAEILRREITPVDRERLLADGVSRLKDAR